METEIAVVVDSSERGAIVYKLSIGNRAAAK